MAEEQERERRESETDSYRPDEGDRLRRAKEWLRVARGKSPEPKK